MQNATKIVIGNLVIGNLVFPTISTKPESFGGGDDSIRSTPVRKAKSTSVEIKLRM